MTFNDKRSTTQKLQRGAQGVCDAEALLGNLRHHLENDIRAATKVMTHEEIAQAINDAGKKISRQRVTQIANGQ